MRTVAGEVHRDFSRDNYWTRVSLFSDEQNLQTEVLLCASYEYLVSNLAAERIDENLLNQWVAGAITDIQRKGDTLFNQPVHFEVRAITNDGYENGLSFLKEKVAATTE